MGRWRDLLLVAVSIVMILGVGVRLVPFLFAREVGWVVVPAVAEFLVKVLGQLVEGVWRARRPTDPRPLRPCLGISSRVDCRWQSCTG
jgi:membrane protein YdbS with pleckstrin-like domain